MGDAPAQLRSARSARVVDVDLLLADGVGDLALLACVTSLSRRTRSFGTACFSTTGSSSWSTTSCSSSEIAGPVGGVAAVGVGDRLALDADLLAAHRDGLGDLVLDDVLLQPHAAGLALGRADAQLLLGARHRVVGRRAAGVAAPTARSPVAIGPSVARTPEPRARRSRARSGGRARASSCSESWPSGSIFGASLTVALSNGTRSTRRPRGAALLIGTNDCLVPNRPVVTSAHSGWLVSRVEVDLLDRADLVAVAGSRGPARARRGRPASWCVMVVLLLVVSCQADSVDLAVVVLPALPPAMAASRVPRRTAARAIRPPVVSAPSSTGMRGRLRPARARCTRRRGGPRRRRGRR